MKQSYKITHYLSKLIQLIPAPKSVTYNYNVGIYTFVIIAMCYYIDIMSLFHFMDTSYSYLLSKSPSTAPLADHYSFFNTESTTSTKPNESFLTAQQKEILHITFFCCVMLLAFIYYNYPPTGGANSGSQALFSLGIVMPSLHSQKTKGIYITFFFVFLFVGSIIIANSPILLVLIMIFLSIGPLLLLVPKRFSTLSLNLLESLVKSLYHLGILKPLFYLYTFLNSILSAFYFKLLISFLGLIFLSFILLSRYLFLLKIEHQSVPLSYLVLYFLLATGVFVRFLCNYAYFIIPFTFNNFPAIGLLLVDTVPDIPSGPSTTPPIGPQITHAGWFNRHYHRHTYYLPPEAPKPKFMRNLGIGFACAGVCLSTFACYQYYKSANAAVVAAEAAGRAADASVKANDLNALSQSIISREEYFKRHPEDKPS